jgi:cell division inhibitor SepF
MGLFDNVKNRLAGVGQSQQYDDYDDNYDQQYDDGYDNGNYNGNYNDDSYYGGEQSAQENTYRPSQPVNVRRRSSLPSNVTPLITTQDVRSVTPNVLDSAACAEPVETKDNHEAYDARSGRVVPRTASARTSHRQRDLVVVQPQTYQDAEKIANGLKAGRLVVVDLKHLRPELALRILDFSFGAASVLGAQVERPKDKVYAFASGGSLSTEETSELTSRGII